MKYALMLACTVVVLELLSYQHTYEWRLGRVESFATSQATAQVRFPDGYVITVPYDDLHHREFYKPPEIGSIVHVLRPVSTISFFGVVGQEALIWEIKL